MAMNLLTRRLIKWIGYPLFALTVFIIFVYVTFPYEKLRYRIEQYAGASGEMELTIEDLGPSPLTGLSAEGVLLMMKPRPGPPPLGGPGMGGGMGPEGGAPPPEEGAPRPAKPKPTRIFLEQVVISAGLIAMLRGGTDFAFKVAGLGGRIEGRYTAQKKEGWTLKLDAVGLKLDSLPALQELVGLPVAGSLSLKIDLAVPQHQLSSASGKIEVECEGCAIGDGKAKLKIPGNALLAMGIKMPRVRLGHLGGHVRVQGGEATLDNVEARSPDIELKLEGSFSLRTPAAFSNAQAYLRFKVSPALKKRDPKFDLLESGLSEARRTDGFFGMRVVGPIKGLRFIPSRIGPPQPGRGGPGMRPGPRGPGGGPRPFRRFPAQ